MTAGIAMTALGDGGGDGRARIADQELIERHVDAPPCASATGSMASMVAGALVVPHFPAGVSSAVIDLPS